MKLRGSKNNFSKFAKQYEEVRDEVNYLVHVKNMDYLVKNGKPIFHSYHDFNKLNSIANNISEIAESYGISISHIVTYLPSNKSWSLLKTRIYSNKLNVLGEWSVNTDDDPRRTALEVEIELWNGKLEF